MNNKRRKQLKQVLQMLNEAQKIIENVATEEEESLSNLPESLQDSEMAETLNDNISEMEESVTSIEEAISNLESVIG
ncbi:MAG: hypothetical protein IKP73_01290 [Bacteroidales bacterium]|nr:hypothetical protein [Bacteroidales bacterium]